MPFTGLLYSDCFQEKNFPQPGLNFFRDEFDFRLDKQLHVTRLWFNDTKCLGAAIDIREKLGSVVPTVVDHKGFRATVLRISYLPPHLDHEVIEFSARVEDRGNTVAFHILNELSYQNGHTKMLPERGPFLLRKKAPLF